LCAPRRTRRSKWLGERTVEVLRIVLRLWIEAGLPSDRETLERLVKTAVETPGRV